MNANKAAAILAGWLLFTTITPTADAQAGGRTEVSPWVAADKAGAFGLKKKRQWFKEGYYPSVSNLQCRFGSFGKVEIRATYTQSKQYLGNAYALKMPDEPPSSFKQRFAAFNKGNYKVSGKCDIVDPKTGKRFIMVIGNRVENKPDKVEEREL